MYGRNVAAFLKPWLTDGAFAPSWEDEVIQGTLVTRDGEVVHGPTREALGAGQAPSGGSH